MPFLPLRPLVSRNSATNLQPAADSAGHCIANAWFCDYFGAALPRGLREVADQMSWESFVVTYGHTAGPLRLGHWACTDTERPAGRLGARVSNTLAGVFG
jgi:hypothetical protein